MYKSLQVKYTLFLSGFNKLEFYYRFSESIKFHENTSRESEAIPSG